MASVNKVILLGNVGKDPEMRYLPDGKAATSISIATSTKRKNRETGEVIEDTQWHRVQFFDRLAELVGEFVKKGNPIYVEGRIRYGKYTDRESGVEKNTVDIVATELQLLGDRQQGGQDRPQRQEQAPRAPAPQRQGYEPRQRPPAPPPAAGPARSSSGFDDMDDDIPFVSCDWLLEVDTSKAKRMRGYDY